MDTETIANISIHSGATFRYLKEWILENFQQLDRNEKYDPERGYPITKEHTHWQMDIISSGAWNFQDTIHI